MQRLSALSVSPLNPLALALCMLPGAAVLAEAPPKPPELPSAAEIRAAARPLVLEEAVRAALAESGDEAARQPKASFGRDARSAFERQFSEAKLPYCLHGDGLKRQSTFFLNGYIALPFIFVARARNKCLF